MLVVTRGLGSLTKAARPGQAARRLLRTRRD